MTREQKIEWLKTVSNEILLKQFESTNYLIFTTEFGSLKYEEDYELVKAELLRRMTK